jgi:hypothetical protein
MGVLRSDICLSLSMSRFPSARLVRAIVCLLLQQLENGWLKSISILISDQGVTFILATTEIVNPNCLGSGWTVANKLVKTIRNLFSNRI